MKTTSEALPEGLADCVITDEADHKVKVGDLWQEHPVVLTWVRHFGCVFCREHVGELMTHLERIHGAGAELVVIGSGTPNFIRGFRDTTKFAGPVYSDAERKSYDAAGLKRGWMRIINPVSGVHVISAFARGFRQSSTQGDNAQQGGVLVVMPPGRVVYRHVSKVAGDNAKPAEVVAALEAAVSSSPPPPRPAASAAARG